ncbi:Kazal peptide Pr13a [Eupeodes corollae]|uniref:Kazal peptide Pr13a n=1 Tax=Eupeodes corollae TaxID=290404 RepID=UPI0024915068|nr:Kazal peptide Pr13a [Eupeodes corollae]
MKLICILLALSLVSLSMSHSLSTEEKCVLNCDIKSYMPVCGTDDEGETRTFNNLCILKTENCLRNLSFQKTADGPCP